jgi:hypothetical protein
MTTCIKASVLFDVPTMSRGWYWHRHPKQWTRRLLFGFVVAALALHLWGTWKETGSIKIESGATTAFFALVIFLILLEWLANHAFKRSIKSSPAHMHAIEWTFTDEGLRHTANGAEHFSPWSHIVKSATNPDGLLIYPRKQAFYWLPNAAFQCTEDKGAVVALLRASTKCEATS